MQITRIVFAAIVVMLMPIALSAQPASFVRANGKNFELCGQPFRFIGFNVRGICHYGKGDVLPFSNASDIGTNLDYCVAVKATVIRVFCAYKNINRIETGNRLQAVLDACRARGIFVLVALTDVHSSTSMHPQGDTAYFTQGACCGFNLLNHQWYETGYTVNYLPQALYLADRFKDHPAVFAWQLGNEIRDVTNGATFTAFAKNVAAQIKAVDPNHMVSVGMISVRQSNISAPQAISIYNDMDFVGSHVYLNTDADDDTSFANSINKPSIIDEAGFNTGNRPALTNTDITKRFNNGADGYLYWGLMATPYDNGDGDRDFGIDQVFNDDDWVAYGQMFHTWGTSLAPTTQLLVAPTTIERIVDRGEAAPDALIDVALTGGGSRAFSTQESSTWFSVANPNGVASCEPVEVRMQFQTATLRPGVYESQLSILSAGAANSPVAVPVKVTVHGFPGDLDGDDDVDQSDFGLFQACLNKPGEVQDDPKCLAARLDDDVDVDLDDFGLLQACFSGPNIPADPNCLD